MQKAIETILAGKLGVSQAEADRTFNACLESMREAFAQDSELRIRGLCTIKVVTRAARAGRNPRTGEPIQIPAKQVPKITASSKLKEIAANTEL